MKRLFILLLVFLCGSQFKLLAEPTLLDLDLWLRDSDVKILFDSVSFKEGEWHFELSRNAMGMLWRTIDGKEDSTGVCNYKQTLIIPKSASLEIKTKGISLVFKPRDPFRPDDLAAYSVWLKAGTGNGVSHRGGNATILEAKPDGNSALYPGIN